MVKKRRPNSLSLDHSPVFDRRLQFSHLPRGSIHPAHHALLARARPQTGRGVFGPAAAK